ncbi:MAG: hypothetical protein KAV87_13035 [Desulfobacteraceae bacterium]|nr:hypothetical protein [Desulfobacteraceae bacterium]
MAELIKKIKVPSAEAPAIKAPSAGLFTIGDDVTGQSLESISGVFKSLGAVFRGREKVERMRFNSTRQLTIESENIRLQNIHGDDPEAFRIASEESKKKYLDRLPENLRAEDNARWNKNSNVALAAINKSARGLEASNAFALFEKTVQDNQGRTRSVNRDYYHSDIATRTAAQDESAQLEFNFIQNLKETTIGSDGRVLINAETQQKALTAYRDDQITSRILGQFERSEDPEQFYRGMLEIGGFEIDQVMEKSAGRKTVKGNTEEDVELETTRVRIMDTMTTDARAALLGRVAFRLENRDQAETRQEAEADDVLQFSQNSQSGVQTDRIVAAKEANNGVLSPGMIAVFREEFQLLEEATVLRTGQRVALNGSLLQPLPDVTNPLVYSEITSDMVSGIDSLAKIEAAENNGDISRFEAGRFKLQNKSIQDTNKALALTAEGRKEAKVNADISLYGTRLGAELGIFKEEGATLEEQRALNRKVSNALISFMEEARAEDKTETVQQIFERTRDATLPLMRGTRRLTMNTPYKSTKNNQDMKINDVLDSEALLEKDNAAGIVSREKYKAARKDIVRWLKDIDKEDAVALERRRAQIRKELEAQRLKASEREKGIIETAVRGVVGAFLPEPQAQSRELTGEERKRFLREQEVRGKPRGLTVDERLRMEELNVAAGGSLGTEDITDRDIVERQGVVEDIMPVQPEQQERDRLAADIPGTEPKAAREAIKTIEEAIVKMRSDVADITVRQKIPSDIIDAADIPAAEPSKPVEQVMKEFRSKVVNIIEASGIPGIDSSKPIEQTIKELESIAAGATETADVPDTEPAETIQRAINKFESKVADILGVRGLPDTEPEKIIQQAINDFESKGADIFGIEAAPDMDAAQAIEEAIKDFESKVAGISPVKIIERAIAEVRASIFRIKSGSPLKGQEPGGIAGPKE